MLIRIPITNGALTIWRKNGAFKLNSYSSGFSSKLLIPHAYINNGSRWHVRAYDRSKSRFADLLISRFRKLENIDEDVLEHEYNSFDNQWNKIVDLEIIPPPDNPHPVAVISELNMNDGILNRSVRASSVGYFLQKLYVDCSKGSCSLEKGHYYRLKLKNRLTLYGVENMHLVRTFDWFEE